MINNISWEFWLALTPLLCCTFFLLGLRKSALYSAAFGLGVTLLLSSSVDFFSLSISSISIAAQSAVLLFLNAALVIVPGLYFSAVLRKQGTVDALVQQIREFSIEPAHKLLILLLGLLPAVESLTGFGVCLLLGVPIYCGLMSGAQAVRVSMLSMNIMPWATLGLATLVGAGLAHQLPQQLSMNTALISTAVFPTLGLCALGVFAGWSSIRRHGWFALILGFCLAGNLYFFSAWGTGEATGVVAGFAAALLGLVLAKLSIRTSPSPAQNEKLQAGIYIKIKPWFPYILLLTLVLLTRLPAGVYEFIRSIGVISNSRTSLRLLASPGILISLAVLLLWVTRPVSVDHAMLWQRAKGILGGLVCFLLMSQLMLENGMVRAIANALASLGKDLLLFSSPLIGMFSGFLTGSGLGGNAMMMPLQLQLGALTQAESLLTAIQNSTAGHTAFTSLPFILMARTIALDYSTDVPTEGELLAFGLKVASLLFLLYLLTIFLVAHFQMIQ